MRLLEIGNHPTIVREFLSEIINSRTPIHRFDVQGTAEEYWQARQ
jgi:hypothetical protein